VKPVAGSRLVSSRHLALKVAGAGALGLALAFAGCSHSGATGSVNSHDGPAEQSLLAPPQKGDASRGRAEFRDETFGNEGFWTDAIRLPQGIAAGKVTPNQALALGLNVDLKRVPIGITLGVAVQLLFDHSGKSSSILNNPNVTIRLINANAVVGFSAKDTNGDGRIDITRGDKVGATCALCHTRMGFSVLRVPQGGAIGFRHDGLATHGLDFGSILALGQNSKAYFPGLQLALRANGGKTLGRARHGLTVDSTEADVDAYLRDKEAYPVGMFDDTVDGNGDPMHNSALFRQDLAGPYGTDGSIAKLDNFSNLVYTVLLDPTTLTTPGGRAFMRKLGGDAAGSEIVDDYVRILAETGVTTYPFVKASPPPTSADSGSEEFPVGLRVDDRKLMDLNAYLSSLEAPGGKREDTLGEVRRGSHVFRSSGCTTCHNANQSIPVPGFIVPMKTIFPGDNPVVLLDHRQPPLNPILDTPESIFDDKMAVVNASQRGLERGIALPLLLDLHNKPNFLHDSSVPSLDRLLDPVRGAQAPHPFYVADPQRRREVIAFLNGLSASR
jgi:hypothetical protein